MRLYPTKEVLKITGLKAYKLVYLEETEKLIPFKHTPGNRYYTSAQLLELMKIAKKPMEASYVCVDCRGKSAIDPELNKELNRLKSEIQSKFENPSSVAVFSDFLTDNLEGSDLDSLTKKAVEGSINKVYISTELGFPADLLPEYKKWFNYLNIELIDVAVSKEKENNLKGE